MLGAVVVVEVVGVEEEKRWGFGGGVEQLGERAVISSKNVRPLGSSEYNPHPPFSTHVRTTEDPPLLNRSWISLRCIQ